MFMKTRKCKLKHAKISYFNFILIWYKNVLSFNDSISFVGENYFRSFHYIDEKHIVSKCYF